MPADRNLLFGILAVQMNFVTPAALIAGMNAWVLEKHRALGEILRDQGSLAADHAALLESLVAAHLKLHNGDAGKSLAAISSAESLARAVKHQVPDADVQASIGYVGTGTLQQPAPKFFPVGASGRFRILRPHARGGLGEVYVAEDTELRREVALKEIRPSHADNQNSRGRFLLEAEVTGGLEHPNIVPVYGLGTYSDGRPYYAMRFIRGDSLQEAATRYHTKPFARESAKTLAFRNLLKRFVDVCNAIAYAHSRGILHRDLKPGNVMLGKYGETLVVDWGLAKPLGMVDSNDAGEEGSLQPSSGSSYVQTQAGTAVGTPAYMSPEQAAGRLEDLGPASDVYSLGATLYAVVTGHPPFAGEIGDVLRNVEAGEFTPPNQVAKAVPAALDAVIRKAMSRRKEDRYPTATALAQEIENVLADEPVSAFAEPISMKTKRWARKHPGTVAAVAATVLVGVFGLSAGLYFVNSEKNLKELARKDAVAAREKEAEEREKAVRAGEAEREAKEQAVKRLAQIEKSNEILGSIFEGLDPKEIAKNERPLQAIIVEKLDKAAALLEAEAIGDSLLVATMQSRFGYSLIGLGVPDKAIPLFLRARETREKRLGPDHIHTLTSMDNVATAYLESGKLDLALPLLEESFKRTKATLGPDHPNTLMCMNNLANVYQSKGKLDLALPLMEETLKRRIAKLGRDASETLMSMNNLANAFEAVGKHELAMPLRQETLELTKAKLGPSHPYTLTSMGNLAHGYELVGKYDLALPLMEETLNRMKATLGPDHPDTISTMGNLAHGYQVVGKIDLALPLMEATLERMQVKLGPDHPATLTSMINLGGVYYSAKKYDRALPLMEETLKRAKVKLGPDHPDTLTSMGNLAQIYQSTGKHDLALPLMEETLERRKVKLGPDHPNTLTSMNNLAMGYRSAGKPDLALPLMEETLKRRKSKLGPDHPSTLASMNNLAMGYRSIGKPDLALPLMEETLERRKAKLGPDHPDTFTSMNNLVLYYQLAGKYDLALPLMEKTLKFIKAKRGLNHNDTVSSMANLAQVYAKVGKYSDAETLLRECLMLREKLSSGDKPTVSMWQVANVKSLLGGALLGQKKYAEAEPLLLAGYEGLRKDEKSIPAAGKSNIPEALDRLVRLAEENNKPDEVKKWKAEKAKWLDEQKIQKSAEKKP
jgi:serine/threonine protein kinase